MKLKSLVMFALLAARPAFAQTPVPTLADAESAVKIISSDPTKLKTYCELNKLDKLDKQMQAAFEKDDTKTLDALNPQAEALVSKLGTEYPILMQGLGRMDETSADAKAIGAALDNLDKQCN